MNCPTCSFPLGTALTCNDCVSANKSIPPALKLALRANNNSMRGGIPLSRNTTLHPDYGTKR